MMEFSITLSIATDGHDLTRPAENPEVQAELQNFHNTYMGEYRLVYAGYDIDCHAVWYEVIFDNPAEHTAFLLRYQ